jgi:tetratricopeptide (TPR) repeat protein
MKKLLIIFSLFNLYVGISQTTNEEYFNTGLDLYNQGKYLEAINQFQLIIENGKHSDALYFNLGNSYYKINDIANSIYYFEKALKLNPQDKDILNNLSYSQNMLIDKIDELPKNQVLELLNLFSNILSIDQWVYLGIIFLYLSLLTFVLYYLNKKTNKKKFYFTTCIVFLLFSVLLLSNGIYRFKKENNTINAIIFENKIDFRTEPNYRSSVVFNLHEGTKVVVKEELSEWTLIQISDGNTGWIESKSIKKID